MINATHNEIYYLLNDQYKKNNKHKKYDKNQRNRKNISNLQKIISFQNDNIKLNITPIGYNKLLNEKIEKYDYYKALNNDEIKNIKNNYLKFYNNKLKKSNDKNELNKVNKKAKIKFRKEIFNKRLDIIFKLKERQNSVTGKKLDIFDKGYYTWSKYYNLLNQANIITYDYFYENGVKKYKYLEY